MRKIVAIAVCAAEGVLYIVIGVLLLGWKNCGGVIPMMILLAVWGTTWVAITKKEKSPQPETLLKDVKLSVKPGELSCPQCDATYTPADYKADAPTWLCSSCKATLPKT